MAATTGTPVAFEGVGRIEAVVEEPATATAKAPAAESKARA
jgi:hypothetical protein